MLGCHTHAQQAAAHGELGSLPTEPGFVSCKPSEGMGRKLQAHIKWSWSSYPLPKEDKETWISYSGANSTSSWITSALCLVKACPRFECLVSIPCQFSSAKLICRGSANVSARGASITAIFIYSETSQQYIFALSSFQIIFSVSLSQKPLPAQWYISARGQGKSSSNVLGMCCTLKVNRRLTGW